MDLPTLLASLDFSHTRLIGILDAIEKSGQDTAKVLAWRPAPGRAHIAWQAMHCAATHDRYVNVRLRVHNRQTRALCDAFGGGSTPSDSNVPKLSDIREKLQTNLHAFKEYLQTADINRKITFPNGDTRSVGESVVLLAWHEAHHQGQIHLTWNMFKAAHGIK